MRGSTVPLVVAFTSVLLMASASAPVATVTAPGAIKISGVDVPATAAAALPVGTGDQISTNDSSALIRFDAGVVTLGKHSSVKLLADGEQVMVCLVEGSYHYKFSPGAKLAVCKGDKVVATGLEGSVSTGKSLKIPAIVASSAGAAAILAGVAQPKSTACPEGRSGSDCSVIQ